MSRELNNSFLQKKVQINFIVEIILLVGNDCLFLVVGNTGKLYVRLNFENKFSK